MSNRHRWLALAVALSLVVGALAPATAIATRGGNPLDNPGDPLTPPLEYGDPEPTGGGAPLQAWADLTVWKQILITSLQIKFGVPVLSSSSLQVVAPTSYARSKRGLRK